MLYAVKAWYFYLITEGKRADHPCRQLRLKDARSGDIQLQDLFTSIELEELMDRKERYPLATLRNRVVISLLIYQGLRQTEITRVRLKDIGLEKGIIYIRAMIRTASRTLTLKPNQVMLLYEYIHEVRPALLKTETDRLVLTLRGTPESGEGINYLIETFKPMFPDRNLNARTIRQSGLEELQAAIEKHHPLG